MILINLWFIHIIIDLIIVLDVVVIKKVRSYYFPTIQPCVKHVV